MRRKQSIQSAPKKDIRTENLNIKCSYIEQDKQYKYLGSIINDNNSIQKEVRERIALGIKAYYANLKVFKSRLVTKRSKLKLYRTVVRAIVTYASEKWALKENVIQKMLVFERKIIRGIFGPTKENQTWRIKNNEELDKLIEHENTVNQIKAQSQKKKMKKKKKEEEEEKEGRRKRRRKKKEKEEEGGGKRGRRKKKEEEEGGGARKEE